MPNSYKYYENSITLATVEDGQQGPPGPAGADGDGYRVESSYDFLYRMQTATDDGASGILTATLFSPDALIFKVYKSDTSTALVPDTNYKYRFYYFGPDVYISEGTDKQKVETPYLLANNEHGTISENDLLTNSFLFHLQGLRDQSAYNDTINAIYDQCLAGQAYFILRIYNNDFTNVYTSYVFYVQNLLASSVAAFEVSANKINAAVRDSKLEFTENGLNIYRGGLTIYSGTSADLDTRIFYVDNTTGNLYISGSGYFEGEIKATRGEFTGTIHAERGEFTGTITAQDGTIGGFNINNTSLTSTDFQYIQYDPQPTERVEGESYYIYDNENDEYILYTGSIPPDGGVSLTFYERRDLHSIILNGSDGSIYANNITLGEFATIDDYIKIGSGDYTSYICNPNKAVSRGYNEEGIPYGLPYFFKVNNNVYLTATGEFGVGRIILDGANSTIKGTGVEQDPNFGWPDFEITPEKAYFRNVDISGKISTMVFEVGHTQAIGGSMLFKPSYKIKSHEINTTTNQTTLKFDEDLTGYLNPYDAVDVSNGFKPNVTYYIYDETNGYTEVLNPVTPQEGVKYYINAPKYITLIDDTGNMIEINNSPIVCTPISYTAPTEQNDGTVVIDINLGNKVPISLIVLGADNDLIIGINSTNMSGTYLRPRGLTISEFNHEQNMSTLPVPRVYLGDLGKAGFDITGLTIDDYSYGLYSNNVILNGSLTTQVTSDYLYVEVSPTPTVFQEGVVYYEKINNEYIKTVDTEPNPSKTYYVQSYTYAGVNTLSKVPANIFDNYPVAEDHTKIVFWAGSANVDGKSIQQSPFQVTERGSLYAYSGVFTGALISRSKIQGVDIYAARIHGAGKDESLVGDPICNYGLAFYDTSQGIVFKTGGDSDTDPNIRTVFSINSYDFKTGEGQSFISINPSDSTVNFNGNDFNGINFIGTTISGTTLTTNNFTIGGPEISDRISYTNGKVTNYIGFDFNGSIIINQKSRLLNNVENPQLIIENDRISCNISNLITLANFQLGDSQENMRYQKVNHGYDLYIKETVINGNN